MKIIFKKMILAVMVAVVTLAAFPVTSAFAQEETPPVREPSTERLEKAWAYQLKVYEKLIRVFEEGDAHMAKAQELIDKATVNGKDASAVQAALNVFSAAVTKSTPIYTEIDALITSHAGFDANGKVTDAVQAKATVQAVRAKLQELKTSMDGTGKALREAVRAFREANTPIESNAFSKDS
jgi:hypothetical protein